MKRVLIFGGTSEGRLLCEALGAWPVAVTVCVATAYGEELLAGLPASVTVHTGRMDQPAMEALMRAPFACVIDATHPYAVLASETIRAAAGHTRARLLRLQRPQSERQAARYAATLAEAVALLQGREGNILAATGAKELDAYTALDGYAKRVYARVLPTEASLARCAALGFANRHIIAMQGPFSQALNEALIRQLDIRWLVTKDGGDFGGFMAKMDAAAACGIEAIVTGRPPEPGGLSMAAILEALKELLEERT